MKGNSETLVDVLEERCRDQAEQRAYVFLENGERESQVLTYRDLALQARRIAAELQLLRAAGERVLLVYPQGLDFIAAFFGCLYAGGVAVPAMSARRGHALARLRAIVKDAEPAVALTTATLLSVTRELLKNLAPRIHIQCAQIKGCAADSEREWSAPGIDADSLAFLQYTSGSTGSPRGVMISHGNILHNQRFIQTQFEHTEDSLFVSWLPIFHDMGLIGMVLQPLYVGFPSVLMSPVAFLQDPRRWLQAITRYSATTSGGPNFSYDMCVDRISADDRAGLDLSSLQVAYNGSEPVNARTLDRFSEAFAPHGFQRTAFYPCYGLAEATLLVTGGKPAERPVVRYLDTTHLEKNRITCRLVGTFGTRALVGCGKSAPSQKVLIMDPVTRYLLEAGQIGEVWVSGGSVAKGYWNREKETQDTFDGWLVGKSRNRFLRTGDLGFLLEGELFITGRMRDLLIIRGQNHYPHDIERTVEKSHPAIRPACAAAFTVEGESNERLVVVFELRGDASCADLKDVFGSVREAVSQEHGLLVSTAALIHTGTIPKTSSGKIQRARCREQFLTDTLEVVAMDCVPKRVTSGVSVGDLVAAARDISMNYQSKCK